jgi:hypothetical protein
MAECERFKTCPFFNDQLAYMPQTAHAMKEKYCYGDKTQCARYLVVIEGIAAPRNLFPNQIERAREIISDAAHRPFEPEKSDKARGAGAP